MQPAVWPYVGCTVGVTDEVFALELLGDAPKLSDAVAVPDGVVDDALGANDGDELRELELLKDAPKLSDADAVPDGVVDALGGTEDVAESEDGHAS